MNARQAQLDFYTELHEGLEPRHAFKQKVQEKPPVIDIKGRIVEIQYLKKTTDGEHHYWHPFEPHARPKFGLDQRGNPWIYQGRYVVTTHGIEDLPEGQVRAERLPSIPKELTDLGKLEWIKYKSDGERTHTIRFPSNPTIARDESGNLHVLTKEKKMAKRSRRGSRSHSMFASSKHSRKHGAKRRHYENPAKGGGKAMEAVKGAAVLGAVGVGTLLLMNYGIEKYNTSRITAGSTPWSENMSAAIEIGVGLGGAALIGMYWKGTTGATAAAGVGAGGVIAGLQRMYDNYRLQQLRNALTQGAGASGASGASGAAPANRALPAGIPQSYSARTRQSCAA